MTTFVDIHVIQTLPPSCLNRDDNGSPKVAQFGGVNRLRVSSQAWKRAVREMFSKKVDIRDLGMRTIQVPELIASQIAKQAPKYRDNAVAMAEDVIKIAEIKMKAGKKGQPKVTRSLLFLSNGQVELLAQKIIEAADKGKKLRKIELEPILSRENTIDLGLFGRMVAGFPEISVDAACQVAHAISTHAVETEFDFFTAMDEVKAVTEDADAGAGMMGSIEFSSATLYRYATVNIEQLAKNLGEIDVAISAACSFVDAFAKSLPSGRGNTFAHNTLPSVINVTVRDDHPLSYAVAFEKPIRAVEGSGYVEKSVQAMSEYAGEIFKAYRNDPAAAFVVAPAYLLPKVDSLGERVSYPELNARITTLLEGLLQS